MVIRQHQRRNQSKSANKGGLKAPALRARKDRTNKSLSVTISIGYATREEDLKFPEAVIKAADQALYRAKGKGRNCLSS